MTREEIIMAKAAKEIKEKYHGDWKAYARDKAAENAAFRGKDLNADKKARYDEMGALCKRLAEIEPGAENVFIPFGNENRHAMVQLSLPITQFIYRKETLAILSKLFGMADDASISGYGEVITITFAVHDMWDSEEE